MYELIKDLMYSSIPVTIIFCLLGFAMLFIALRNHKSKKRAVLFDELLLAGLHILLLFYYPLMFSKFDLAPNLYFFSNLFVMSTLFIVSFLILLEAYKVHKNPKLKRVKSYSCFKKFFAVNEKNNRFRRRLTHMLPIFVILPIYIIFKLASPWLATWDAWCSGFIVFLGLSFIVFFSVADIVRVLKIHLLPKWGWDLFGKGLNKEEVENNTFTTTSAMVLGLSPWILADFTVFFVVALVTSVSDAMAALVGYRFGKRNFPKKSKKTVEGYIAGFVMTFWMALTTFLVLSTINPLMSINIAALVAMSFFLIDFINLPIDDNKINPHVVGLVMILVLTIL